ncbi:MAG: hypothetical protein COB02_07395 [Candidatus Cloacimonadota bacterium]|nr:MAG: hypothetical protein COB02_07395 [Candidatus Cloacimonadota bacterium]
MIHLLFIFLLLNPSNFAIKRAIFTPRAREFKYISPRVISLEQNQIYGIDYVDIYLKFTTKVEVDKMDLIIETQQTKAILLYKGITYKKYLEIPIKFKNKSAKLQFRILKKKHFGLVSFKLQSIYEYPVDRVLEYIADRDKSDYLVDKARFKLIKAVKDKLGEAENIFSLNLYGKKFLKK